MSTAGLTQLINPSAPWIRRSGGASWAPSTLAVKRGKKAARRRRRALASEAPHARRHVLDNFMRLALRASLRRLPFEQQGATPAESTVYRSPSVDLAPGRGGSGRRTLAASRTRRHIADGQRGRRAPSGRRRCAALVRSIRTARHGGGARRVTRRRVPCSRPAS